MKVKVKVKVKVKADVTVEIGFPMTKDGSKDLRSTSIDSCGQVKA